MTKDKKLVPVLRFPEFKDCGEWEEDSLSELTSHVDYRGKTPQKSIQGIFLVTAKNIKMGYIDYNISKEYISEEIYETAMTRGKPKLGDVLFTTEAPCGNVAQVDNINIALAQRIIKYRGKNLIDNNFLKYTLLSEPFQKKLHRQISGGIVQGIKGSILHKMNILYSNKPEQQKIADCLSSLDKIIDVQSKKVEELTQHKNALLQKLFPTVGKTMPEVRFKEFENSGEWKEEELESFLTEHSIRNKKNKAEDVLSVSNIDGFVPQSKQFTRIIASSDLSNYKVVTFGMYAYNPSRINIGSIAKMKYCNSGTVSPLYVTFSVDEKVEIFFEYYIETDRFNLDVRNNTSGGVRNNLGFKALAKFKMNYPANINEQKKIADCIESIDELIILHKDKLESLKEHKKALMNNLFPK